MKSRILAAAAVLVLAGAPALVAQQTPGAPPPPPAQGGGQNRAAQRMAALLQGITLTDVQRTRIDSINAAYTAAQPPMQQGVRPDSAQMAQRRAAGQKRDADIRGVLTAEQQTVWDHNMETMRANMPQRP